MSLPKGKLIAIGGAEDKGTDLEKGEINRNNLKINHNSLKIYRNSLKINHNNLKINHNHIQIIQIKNNHLGLCLGLRVAVQVIQLRRDRFIGAIVMANRVHALRADLDPPPQPAWFSTGRPGDSLVRKRRAAGCALR